MGWETSPRTVQSDGIANAGYPFTPAVRGGPQIIILNAWNE
jgi:hypothetical protein